MEMLKRCLDVEEAKASLKEFDKQHDERKELLAVRREGRGPEFGNRKARRRAAAMERQG